MGSNYSHLTLKHIDSKLPISIKIIKEWNLLMEICDTVLNSIFPDIQYLFSEIILYSHSLKDLNKKYNIKNNLNKSWNNIIDCIESKNYKNLTNLAIIHSVELKITIQYVNQYKNNFLNKCIISEAILENIQT